MQKSPEAMLPGFSFYQCFRSPVMPPVAVPAIIGPAVIGVGTTSVVGRSIIVVIAIARSISVIGTVAAGGNGTGGQCAGSQAERQPGADPSPPRLSRRGHDGCAHGGNRRQ